MSTEITYIAAGSTLRYCDEMLVMPQCYCQYAALSHAHSHPCHLLACFTNQCNRNVCGTCMQPVTQQPIDISIFLAHQVEIGHEDSSQEVTSAQSQLDCCSGAAQYYNLHYWHILVCDVHLVSLLLRQYYFSVQVTIQSFCSTYYLLCTHYKYKIDTQIGFFYYVFNKTGSLHRTACPFAMPALALQSAALLYHFLIPLQGNHSVPTCWCWPVAKYFNWKFSVCEPAHSPGRTRWKSFHDLYS